MYMDSSSSSDSEPTRITPTPSTLIDLIYTNCADKIACSGVRHVAISDHSMGFAIKKLALKGMSNGNNTVTCLMVIIQ